MSLSAGSKRRSSSRKEKQWKHVKKVYDFDENDKNEAKRLVQRISQQAIRVALNASKPTTIFDFGLVETYAAEEKQGSLSADFHSDYSQSSYLSQERAIFRGRNRASFEENENGTLASRDKNDFATSTFRRQNKGDRAANFVKDNLAQYGIGSQAPPEAWMCGVCAKSFSSYEAACRHEDYHIREIVTDLGWAQDDGPEKNIHVGQRSGFRRGGAEAIETDQTQTHPRSQQQITSTSDAFRNPRSQYASSKQTTGVTNSSGIHGASRPDLLTLSSSNLHQSIPISRSHRSPSKLKASGRDMINANEHQISPSSHGQSLPYKIDDFVVLADEALVDVCTKAEKLALSKLEQEAEFELECYSNDKHYYDMLEQREIERRKGGAYSRFRTEGKNIAQKIQNKFVDAYAVMKEGKSKKTMSTVDHYKRKLEGDSDVQNVMANTKQTLYVNVIVKNSIQVVSHELDRLARQRWEEHKNKEGSTDIRNEESRAQFEKFKARAQGQLVQLAGLALASDFTPRRIAVQLSNDLYRLLTPRLKRRGVLIESEIEYRVGPYFVLAVNVVAVDWRRLVKMTYKDVAERRRRWMKMAENDDAKEGVSRRYGPLASLIRLSKMTKMEVLAGFVATLYYTHWAIYTPICWFLYRFLIGEIFRKYFLSSVTDEIFYYVEQKGMQMNIQIHDAETQAACMLSALQEIRADSRAFKKKQEKARSKEGEAELLGPLLGGAIKEDNKAAPPIPDDFEPPENLEFVSLELNLQVGFQRVRRALLSSESQFITEAVWKSELKYDDIVAGEWNKYNDAIGMEKLPDGVNYDDFIGAERETSYLMPKSAFVAANTAYETAFIETYNDYCFSLKLRALTPDVPYGSTFEAWTKYIVVNTGNNSCKLTCSVEAVFPNGPPMISRQIKSGMRDGVGEVFVKTGEAFQRYANAYS